MYKCGILSEVVWSTIESCVYWWWLKSGSILVSIDPRISHLAMGLSAMSVKKHSVTGSLMVTDDPPSIS